MHRVRREVPARYCGLFTCIAGGKKEVTRSVSSGTERRRCYRKVVESAEKRKGKYQLLCANCNWMKRVTLRL